MKQPVTTCLLIMISVMIARGQSFPLPYQTGFDAPVNPWTVTTLSGTAWELGTPSAQGTQGAYSLPYCWGTDPDSGYRANSFSYLSSPVFLITNPVTPYLRFRQFRYMSSGLDGFHLEISKNSSAWTHVNAQNPGDTTNWYNSTSLFSTGLPGFTGVSGGWQLSGIRLPAVSAGDSLRIRFVFRSNSSFGSAQPGVFIDDFYISDSLPAGIDVRPVALVSPTPYLIQAQNQMIRVIVRNQSFYPVDSIRISTSLDGSAFQQQTVFAGLAAGEEDTVDFGNRFFATGPHLLRVVASVNGDILTGNDTLTATITVQSQAVLPYFNNFETDTSGWMALPATLTNWEYGTPAYGFTTGAFSGQLCWDINLTTPYASNALAVLQSPSFDLSQAVSPYLTFALNCAAERGWDGLRMEYSINNGTTWTVLGTVGDTLGRNWYTDSQLNSSNLPAWDGNFGQWIHPRYRITFLAGNPSVRFRFIFTSDASVNQDGVSIDDFRIEETPPYDLSLDSIAMGDFCYPNGSNSGPITLRITNNGTQPATGFTVGYQMNGTTIATQTFSGTLPPYTTTNLQLPGTVIPQGIQDICATISWSPDTNLSNNQYCTTAAGVPTDTLTYFNNFDNGPAGWVQRSYGKGASNTKWEHGAPQYGLTNSAHSAPYAWDINLDTSYTTRVTSELYSPFYDLAGTFHPSLSFWQNRNLFPGSLDGLRIDYRLNQDTTWKVLGKYADPLGTNWYTISFVSGTLKPGWTGTSAGWIPCTYNLDSVSPGTGTIQFRLVFTAASTGYDGVSIDDFMVSTVYDFDASIKSIPTPQGILLAGAQVPLKVVLANVGSQTITSLDIKYQVGGGAVVTFPWTGSLPPDSSITVTAGTVTVQAGNNPTQAWVSWPSDQYLPNDTAYTNFFGLPTNPLPYAEDFESGDGFWYNSFGTPGTVWEYGTPTTAPLNTAHSGSSCWDVNLSTLYGNLAFAALESPGYTIAGVQELLIGFWQNYRTESDQDGAFMQYSYDGAVWQVLGTINDSLGNNWYNSALYGGRIGWSGIGNGWTYSTYRFRPATGSSALRLRFVFVSDASLVDAGFSIDDIQLSVTTGIEQHDAGVQKGLTIYPNPAKNQVMIESLEPDDVLHEVRVLSSLNATVRQFDLKSTTGQKALLELIGLNPGHYILQIQTQKGRLISSPLVIVP